MIEAKDVSIFSGEAGYPKRPPFGPSDAFPEYPFGNAIAAEETNHTYRAVRGALGLLGLDAANFGSPEWNPLGRIVRPGDTVVLKPNFIRHFRETRPGHDDCLVTHGAIIRAVLDYVYIALKGRGRIVIADAPQNDADFPALRRMARLDEIQDFYRQRVGFDVEVYDLRPEQAKKIDGVIVGHLPLPGDPAGYVKVNLGMHSVFAEINHLCHLLYGAEYETGELRCHHHDEVHEYLISKTILDADCVIGLAKLKTHKKTGITASMKNWVGINGNKNWLPHHREGTPAQGGDQFADDGIKHRVERSAVTHFKRLFPLLGSLRPALAGPIKAIGRRLFGDTNEATVRSGNWYGNDTTWRMVLDLNRILMYADAKGELHDRRVRRSFSLVDGVVAGEGNGPLDPTPRAAGVVLAGLDPAAVDAACARLMGFDCRKIPLLANAPKPHRYPLCQTAYEEVRCRSNHEAYDRPLGEFEGACLAFAPHFGWKGHIKIDAPHAEPHAERGS